MKKIFNYTIVFAAAFAVFTACKKEKEDVYIPAEKEAGAQYYFPADAGTKFSLTAETTALTVDLCRVESASAGTAKIAVTEETGILVPGTALNLEVPFEAGAETALISIPVKMDGIDYGETFTLTLKVLEESTQYGASELALSVVYPEPWVSLGLATYVDTFVADLWSAPNAEYEVELQENQVKPGFYRLVNPYGEAYPYNDPGDWDDSRDYFLEIHAEEPDAVYIEVQGLGFDWGYGEFLMGSLAGYYMAQGASLEEMKAEGYTGTLKDGILTFPNGVLLVGDDDGLAYANSKGAFKLVFPGIELSDYSIDFEYAGLLSGAEGTDYAVLNVTLGEDVEAAKIAAVAGEDPDAALELIQADDEAVVTVVRSGEVKVPVPGFTDLYTVVAVPVADGTLQESEAVYDVFEYKDLSVSVMAGTPEANADGSSASLAVSVAFGKDVEYARVAVIPGRNIADEDLDVFFFNENSLPKVDRSGGVVTLTLPETGTYTVLAVSYAFGSPWNLAFTSVSFSAVPVKLLLSEDFEDINKLGDWFLFDVDGDGNYWNYSTQLTAHSGKGLLFSMSYDNNSGPLRPDNWVFTNAVTLTQNNYLSFWVAAQDNSYNAEHYAAYVTDQDLESDDVELPGACVKLHEATIPAGSPVEEELFQLEEQEVLYQRFVVPVPAQFNGKTVRFGFRHFNCTDEFYLNLDDVMVTEGNPAPSGKAANAARTQLNTRRFGISPYLKIQTRSKPKLTESRTAVSVEKGKLKASAALPVRERVSAATVFPSVK